MDAISGFRRELADNYALLGCDAARSGNFLSKFQDNILVTFGFLNPEDGTDNSSRNVGYKLPLVAA
jgi:hypothetical protein